MNEFRVRWIERHAVTIYTELEYTDETEDELLDQAMLEGAEQTYREADDLEIVQLKYFPNEKGEK